jgi:hypothetical protein
MSFPCKEELYSLQEMVEGSTLPTGERGIALNERTKDAARDLLKSIMDFYGARVFKQGDWSEPMTGRYRESRTLVFMPVEHDEGMLSGITLQVTYMKVGHRAGDESIAVEVGRKLLSPAEAKREYGCKVAS